jgi:hypothetical protein
MRYFVFGLIALSLPWVTDRLVDSAMPENHGYSQADIAGVTALLYPARIKPVTPKPPMSAGEQAAALKYLWGQP